MRTLVTAAGRHLAVFITLAMLTSSIAMAAYVCPKTTAMADMAAVAMTAQTPGMDELMPAHCAERHAGDKQALERSGGVPGLAMPAIVFFHLIPAGEQPAWQTRSVRTPVPLFRAHAPPFLRTQRLRI